jgi:hypothetical protein
MPGVVETTYTFVANQVITSTLMNNIIDETTFTSTALANGTLALTAGQMKVATGGITSNELAADAVTANAIAADAVTTAKILDANVTTAKIPDGAVTFPKLTLPSNFPIQVVQAVKTDVQTIAGTASAFSDITGLSITLTRANPSASGKIRVQANISTTSNEGNHGLILRIMRGSTAIGLGDASGIRIQATSNTGYNGAYANNPGVIDFIDSSPGSSSTVTYKIQAKMYSTRNGYINRVFTDDNSSDYVPRTISTLTLTELTP